jgi:hypothetical protein
MQHARARILGAVERARDLGAIVVERAILPDLPSPK